MKKVLFIDRDGTLIVEPPVSYQVDSLDQLEFLPGVFRSLYFISQNLDYELVIVSNQDGLGSETYPKENFDRVQDKMLKAFHNEGIEFNKVFIDASRPEDDLPTRKPGTAMLKEYFSKEYDLGNSFVIGDRITDVELAKNLGAKAILIGGTVSHSDLQAAELSPSSVLLAVNWEEIHDFLISTQRRSHVCRKTSETSVDIRLSLDGSGKTEISTGLGFFDHMLEQISRHGGMDLEIKVKGDLHVDEHHTIEDTGLALGEAFSKALGDRKGLSRYGFLLPMDESLASVALDLGGRNYLVWNVPFSREMIGEVPTEMFEHFFKSFTDTAKCNLHIESKGDNDHHRIEAVFKAFAKTLAQASGHSKYELNVPSTKGKL